MDHELHVMKYYDVATGTSFETWLISWQTVLTGNVFILYVDVYIALENLWPQEN